MKQLLRFLLFLSALVVGGISGYFLLCETTAIKIIIFALLCSVLGEVFCIIDKKIQK